MDYFFSRTLAQIPPVAEPQEKVNVASPELLEIGRQQYMLCAGCHGQQGEGLAAGPPLAGSEWVNGPVENLIKIQLRGLQGPIVVKGQEYNIPGGMAALAYQSDEQIAGVLSYVRSNFGNRASGVTPEQVAALRSEVGKPQITVEELEEPKDASGGLLSETGVLIPASDKYKDLEGDSGVLLWLFVAILGAVAVVGVGVKFVAKKK